MRMGGQVKNVLVTTNQPVVRLLHRFHRDNDEHPWATDVTLVAKGGYIPMHSVVLAAGSPVLKEHFAQQSKSERENTVVHLHDYHIDDITVVAMCFYTGSCVFPRKQLRAVYEIFEQLGISANGMTLSEAGQEDLNKGGFIRRYMDVDELEDEDMFIEEGERVNISDIPPEALNQLRQSGPVVNLSVRPTATEVPLSQPANSGEGNPNGGKEQRKNYPHYVKTQPPKLDPVATKVSRDCVTGVKDGEEESSSNEESDSSVKSGRKSKKRAVVSDDEGSDATVAVAECSKKKDRKDSRGKDSKARKRSSKRRRQSGEDEKSSSDESADVNSNEDSEEDYSSHASSNDDDSPPLVRRTRSRTLKKTRLMARRNSNKRSNRSGSEESNDDGAKNLAHSLRKRKKCVYNEANSSEDMDDGGGKSRKMEKERNKRDGCNDASGQSDFDPAEAEEEEDEEESSSSSDYSSDSGAETTGQGQDVDESEKCYLRDLVIRLEKLPPEEVEKYKRKATSQTQKQNSSNGDESRTGPVEGATVATEKTGSALLEEESSRSRAESSRKGSVISSKKSATGVSRRNSSSSKKKQQPECSSSSKKLGSQEKDIETNTTIDTTKQPSVEMESCSSTVVLTSTQATEATKAVLVSDRTTNLDALKKWYEETLFCQFCETRHLNDISASRCLKSHKLNRCWICLKLLKFTEKFEDHCKNEHKQSRHAHANCPLCEQLLPWNLVYSHIKQVHFNKISLLQLQEPDPIDDTSKIDSSIDDESGNKTPTRNGELDESVTYAGSPDVNPGGFTSGEDQLSKQGSPHDSDDESANPIRIKPAAELFESDHDDDIDEESEQNQVTVAGSNTASPMNSVSARQTSEVNPGGTTAASSRPGSMPEQLSWLGSTLRNEEASRSGLMNKNTSTYLGNPIRPGRLSLTPLTNRHQLSGYTSQIPAVNTFDGASTFSQSQLASSPRQLSAISDPSLMGHSNQTIAQSKGTINRSHNQTNQARDVSSNTHRVPNAPHAIKTYGNNKPSGNTSVITGTPSRSMVEGQRVAGSSNEFIRNAGCQGNTPGNMEAARNVSALGTQVPNASRRVQETEVTVNPESIADQIKNKLQCQKAHAVQSSLNQAGSAQVNSRTVTPGVPPSLTNANLVSSSLIGKPDARVAHSNLSLAAVAPANGSSPQVAFRFPKPVPQSNVLSTVSSSPVSTTSERQLLVSNPSSVSTTSATLLSSRNVVPGPIQGQLRPVLNHPRVLNPESALVVRNPNIDQSRPEPPSYKTHCGSAAPSSGPVVLNSRSLGTNPSVSGARQFFGSALIDGVPFKVFSRPTNSNPHPQAVVSVRQDQVFNGRNIQQPPQNLDVPRLSVSGTELVADGMYSAGSMSSIEQFQMNMQMDEAVTVNELHAQANSIHHFQEPQGGSSEGELTGSVEINSNLLYRCDRCGEDFNAETSLQGHLCFELD